MSLTIHPASQVTHVRAYRVRVAFAQHVSQLHQDIHDRVLSQYASYKQAADLHCRPWVFQVGDQVMVRLRPERYAPALSTGPSRVLSRIGGIAYVVDIPPSWGNSSTFHVMDLTSHPALPLTSDVKPSPTGPFIEREFAWKSTFPALPPDRHERVEEIFREVIDFSGDGVSWRFFVHWPGRPLEDDVYISEVDLERLRSDHWSPCRLLLPTRRSRVLPTPGGLVAYDPVATKIRYHGAGGALLRARIYPLIFISLFLYYELLTRTCLSGSSFISSPPF